MSGSAGGGLGPYPQPRPSWLRRHGAKSLLALTVVAAAVLAWLALRPEPAQGIAGTPSVQDFAAVRELNARMTDQAVPLIERLARDPSLLPPQPGVGAGVLSFSGTMLGGPGAMGGLEFKPTVVTSAGPGSLRFDRALAARRTSRPEYWALLFTGGADDPVYWLPVTDPRRVRVEGEGVITLSDAPLTLRLPVLDPTSIINLALFSSDPAEAGSGPAFVFSIDPQDVPGLPGGPDP